jgi:hypothetical protein
MLLCSHHAIAYCSATLRQKDQTQVSFDFAQDRLSTPLRFAQNDNKDRMTTRTGCTRKASRLRLALVGCGGMKFKT